MAKANPDDFSSEKWTALWESGKATWHRQEVRGLIVKYYDLLTNKGESKRILIPLCGKSKDLLYFYQQGHEVVGVEFSYKACQEFFQENGINFSVESHKSGPSGEEEKVLTSDDKRIVLYQGDFFGVTREKLGVFDAILDWNSLCAIDSNKRMVYIEMLNGFLKPGGKVLLNTLVFPKAEHVGPPCTIYEAEIMECFQGKMEVKLLEETKEETEGIKERFKLSELSFVIYLLTKL